MTVLPQASGTAIARTPRMIGAFHGAMPSTTPTGSRSAMARQPGLSDGMTSPPICVVIAAASRTMLAASIRLNMAQPAVAPISAIMAATKSSLRASSAAAAFIKHRAPCVRPEGRPGGKAKFRLIGHGARLGRRHCLGRAGYLIGERTDTLELHNAPGWLEDAQYCYTI